MHTPVLLQEAIDALEVFPGGRYIDATYGSGGHCGEIVKRRGCVLALEWDEHTVLQHKSLSASIKRPSFIDNEGSYTLVWSNYADIEARAKEYNFNPCDGVIFDLGLSMGQITSAGRGFSYKALRDPLDMRIWRGLPNTGADIVNSYTEEELYELFAKYSQELNSRKLARTLVFVRRIKQIKTVGSLVSVVERVAPNDAQATSKRVFQALRIEVNHELENIEKGLAGACNIIKKNAPIVIISFHQTEDRLIKLFAYNNRLKIQTIKPKGADIRSFEKNAKIRILKN